MFILLLHDTVPAFTKLKRLWSYMWILGAIIKIKTLVLVKIIFIGTIPMPPRLNQSRVRYIYIFWFFEARAFCYIRRLILNVILLVVLKKTFKDIYMMSMTSYN